MPASARRALLILLVAGAAALRFWGLDQGLPHPSSRPDEREVLEYTRAFPAGDLNPRWFIYPPFYFYLTWAWVEGILAARRAFVDTPPYTEMLTRALPDLLLYGRALSAVTGTAAVALLYAVGRRVGGSALGLLAALLLAVNLLHVRDSHALKTDAPLALAVLASVWLLGRYQERPDRLRAVAAGVLIGIATGIKYNGILLMVPAYLADTLASGHTGIRRLVPSGRLVLLAAVATATFVVIDPYLVLDLQRTIDTVRFSSFTVYSTRHHSLAPPDATTLERLLNFARTRSFGYHLAVSLRWGSGLATALATPLALVWAFRRPRQPTLVLAAVFCVIHFLAIGASPVQLARYLTAIVPLLLLLVANLVVGVVRAVPQPALRATLGAVLTLALVAEPLHASVAQDRIVGRTDTRILALEWMADHIPPGAVVAILGGGVTPYADPILPPGVERVPPATRPGDFARLGVGYVVTHEHQLPFSRPNPRQLAALGPSLRLLAEFRPYRDGPAGWFEDEDAYYVPFRDFGGVERPGPVVRVYAWAP